MLILGIETSCDETAAALVEDGTILSNIILPDRPPRQLRWVVPEVASGSTVEAIGYVIKEASTRPTDAFGH